MMSRKNYEAGDWLVAQRKESGVYLKAELLDLGTITSLFWLSLEGKNFPT